MSLDAEEILNFWFYEVGPDLWFKEDPELDKTILSRFEAAYASAEKGELSQWEETPEGVIALLLLLDAFPRLMFRGTPRAYATDEVALEIARQAVINHFDDRIDRNYKLFFYLPFQHSENMGDQRLASFYVRERTKEPSWVSEVERCYQIIQVFGRFPERNEALGRDSTEDERAYLEDEKRKQA